ncbi:DUF3275 family protein, partial [Pseudomonas aeruginosa]|nr:DUF3275 family protein [Pseudomonas aeruginosa]
MKAVAGMTGRNMDPYMGRAFVGDGLATMLSGSVGGARFEVRANLDGMTLNGIDKLSRDEARSFATQEVDPLDEELGTQPAETP